ALERLTARISEMDAKDREAHLLDRTLSCRISDLGMTFVTRLGPNGADGLQETRNDSPPAQVRFTAQSDVVVAVAADPGSFLRAWLSGRLKVEGNFFDLLHLRKLMKGLPATPPARPSRPRRTDRIAAGPPHCVAVTLRAAGCPGCGLAGRMINACVPRPRRILLSCGQSPGMRQ